MTYRELKKQFAEQLMPLEYSERECDNLYFECQEHFLGRSKMQYLMDSDALLSEDDLTKMRAAQEQLKQAEPIQYILGKAWFDGEVFKVDPNVLIPRPETEELVRWVLDEPAENARVLDIGTGSGCIPISISKHRPKWEVYGLDVSEGALGVARTNNAISEGRVEWIQADALQENILPDIEPLDILISNPPYVRESEKREIRSNVLKHEPHLALFVEDEDPLLFYRKIGELGLKKLAPEGVLFFEINQYLGAETCQLLIDMGYKNVELRKDLSGNDRMIRATRS